MGGVIERGDAVTELIARVAKLETEIADMTARLERLEAAAKRARKDRREGEAEYQIGALIG